MKRYFKILLRHYGSHRAVARELGISETHYRRVRNGHHPGSKILRMAIVYKATIGLHKDLVK